MSIIHRYILRELFYYLAVLTIIFCVILLAKTTYDVRDEILDESPAWTDVAEYVVLSIPSQLIEAIPLLSLFSVLFALGLMAKNRELLAMVAAGIPFTYLAVPIAIFGILMTAVSFLVTEYVAPASLSRAKFVLEVRLKGENQFSFNSDDKIFRKGEGNRFYIMSRFDAAKRVMNRPSIIDLMENGSGIARRLDAEKATYREDGGLWEFEGAEVWTFNPDGAPARPPERFATVRYQLEDKLVNLLSREKKPEEMQLSELREYVSILERQGSNAQLPRYRTSIQSKISLPFSCLMLALIGFAIASDLHTRRFVLAFSIGLAFGILYIVLRESVASLGFRGMVPPLLAAWMPVAIFTAVVAGLMRRLSTVH